MSLGDVGKVCLFSSMSGAIKLDGKPVPNALLKRTVKFNKPKTDETRTNEQGHFEFPAIFEHTVTKFLPQEFVANQEITLYYQGEEYRMWTGVKRTPEENAESRGEPLIVECELSNQRQLKQVNNSPIISLCTWSAEADQVDTGF